MSPITDVSGIITIKEEGLLSHPAIRARQYGIPFAICPGVDVLEEMLDFYGGGLHQSNSHQHRHNKVKTHNIPLRIITGQNSLTDDQLPMSRCRHHAVTMDPRTPAVITDHSRR